MKKVAFILMLIASFSFAKGLTLSSKSLQGQLSNAQVFNGFGCTGENISPDLSWKNPPTGTKSFAITAYDPDAPTGSGWWHWVVFNIDADIKTIESGGKIKGAVESKTDYGFAGFGGACPPKGDIAHQYIFTVYALDVEKLDLKVDASAALVGFFLNSHAIEKASIIGYYQR